MFVSMVIFNVRTQARWISDGKTAIKRAHAHGFKLSTGYSPCECTFTKLRQNALLYHVCARSNMRENAYLPCARLAVGNMMCMVFNSWPTFSPYLYNRVSSELTTRNPPGLFTLEWTHTGKREQTRVWIKYGWRCKPVKRIHSTSELQRSWIKLVRPLSTVKTFVTLVYSTVDCGLTVTYFHQLYALMCPPELTKIQA